MIATLKSFLSVLMSILCFCSCVVFGNFAGEFSPKKDGSKLNFAVISDIHMTDETARRDMLELGLYDMQQADTQLDALVLSGDMTEHASRVQYDMLASAFSKYTPAKNIVMAVGNHDTWCGDVEDEFEFAESKKLFIEYNKKIANRDIDNVYYSTTVNDYTFIMMSSEYNHTDAYISDAQLKWLDRELEKASDSGKPIFVVSHWPLAGSHGLPLTWLDNPISGDKEDLEPDDGGFGEQNDKVNAILQKYENIFLISGHLHNGVAENSRYGYSSVEKIGNITSINLPSYMYLGMKGAVSNGLGFVFEVYDNEVLIRTRSFTAGVWYTSSEFSAPIQPKPAITLADVSINNWESQGDHIEGEAQSGIVNTFMLTQQSSYTLAEQTAATGQSSTFVNGDQIGIYAWTGAADEVPAERVVDGAVNTFNGSGWSAAPQMLWKNTVKEHYFLGVYPAHEITDFKADPYTLDTSDQAKSDLLIAVNNDGLKAQHNPVQLTFDHAMAKIRVNLHFRNKFGGTPNIDNIALEGYTQAEIDYMAKTVIGKNIGDVLIPLADDVAENFELSFESIVIPSSDTKTIRISIDGKDYIYHHDTYIPLNRGKVTTINLNVGRDEVTLANVSINDWESQGDHIEGEAQNFIVNQSASVSLQETAVNTQSVTSMRGTALKTDFSNGDQAIIYGWTGDKTTVPQGAPINSVNTLNITGNVKTWEAAPQMLWQSQTAAHYFLGIYPMREVTNFSADAYVLDETKQEESDILVALSDDQGIVANNRGVDLEFDHIMAKININLNFRNEFEEMPTPSEVKLYCGKEATINYLTKEVNAPPYVFDASKYIAFTANTIPTTGFDTSYSSVVIPQTGINIIDIVINGKTYRFECFEDIPLESGKVTTINLNVGCDQIKLANVTANTWEDGNTIDGEATKLLAAAASLEPNSRYSFARQSASTPFANGSKIKIYGWTGDKTSVPTYPHIDSVNTLTVASNVATWEATPKMLWQSQTAAHYFLGIYPMREVTNFSADAYVLDETKQDESDILVALSDDQGIVANNRGVDLEFDHIMAKININLNFRNEFGSQAPTPDEVRLYCGKEATINYLAKEASAPKYKYNANEYISLPVTALTEEGFDASYSSIAVPQGGVCIIDVIIDDVVYRYEYSNDIPLESGKITTVNLNVGEDISA